MIRGVVGRVAALAAVIAAASPAPAIIVGGGGSKTKDCLVVFDAPVNFPVGREKQVRCVDGDSLCDSDGAVNGLCSIPLRVCVNSTFNSGVCTQSGVTGINVDHAIDNGADRKFDPDFLALQQRVDEFFYPVDTPDTCTSQVVITVPIKGPLGNNHCGRRQKKLKLRSVAQSIAGVVNDTDTLKLSCEPATVNGCDPQTLYASTFDRIQRQIFNQSCAVGSCHDSESMAGGLLLETGAAHGNLVNELPTNGPAEAAGWRRVTVFVQDVSGGAEESFLYRKIEGDLPDATYGDPMPRGKAKLPGSLREVIRLWIEAGAPEHAWVPGTF